MASRLIDDYQDIIFNGAFKIAKSAKVVKSTIHKNVVDIIKWISERKASEVNFIIGNQGNSLHAFCDKVDLDHPHLPDLLIECGVDVKQLSLIKEAIQISNHLKDNDYKLVSELIRNQFVKYREISKEFTRRCGRPPVRLLKSLDDRNSSRSGREIKQPKNIVYSNEVSRMSSDNFKNDFKSYFCGYSYEDELEQQKSMHTVFNSMHIPEFSKLVADRMSETKSRVQDQYYGFVRITPVDASLTLAKSMGMKWADGTRYVQVPRSIFSSNAIFWPNSEKLSATPLPLKYQPNKYPLHMFNAPLPERAAKIIELVESYPVIGNKAIFDHFWVICPSFHLDPREFCHDRHGTKWQLKLNGKEVNVDWTPSKSLDGEVNKAATIVDNYLTEINFITPVILGERNGKCFFICYYC